VSTLCSPTWRALRAVRCALLLCTALLHEPSACRLSQHAPRRRASERLRECCLRECVTE